MPPKCLISRPTSTGARGHQRAFQTVPFQAVQNAGRQSDHVFQSRADLVTDQIRTVVKADQIALQQFDQIVFRPFFQTVDHRRRRYVFHIILHMAGAGKNGDMNVLLHFLAKNVMHDFGRRLFQPFHRQKKGFAVQVISVQFPCQRTQMLTADRNDDGIVNEHFVERVKQIHIVRKG